MTTQEALIGLEPQPKVPRPREVWQQLQAAQFAVRHLRSTFRLSQEIYGPLECPSAASPNGEAKNQDKVA